MSRIYVVGIGPGSISAMTEDAKMAIENSDVIVGYKVYTDLIKALCEGKETYDSGMRQEIERCKSCVELAMSGKTVSLICSGDAGVYAMASPMLEVARVAGFSDVVIIPGVTSALSGAAVLGAPLAHDFCTISLSDLLTSWETIETRLRFAASADFCIVLYNPASRKRADYLKRACDILMETVPSDRVCGYVRNIGRCGEEARICTLRELADEPADMFVTVFIGNSQTYEKDGRMITPRGYKLQ